MKATQGLIHILCSEQMGKNISDMFWFVSFVVFLLIGKDNYWKSISSQGTGNPQVDKNQN